MRVLVVEDHAGLAKNIARALRDSAAYAVDISCDGQDGLFMARPIPMTWFCLISCCPASTASSPSLPPGCLISGPRPHSHVADDKETTVALLNAGADDFLTKPFEIDEMVARSRALIRRSHGHTAGRIHIDDLVIHPEEMAVTRGGRPLSLTAMEYRLLEYMAHRPRAVLSKSELLDTSTTITGRNSAMFSRSTSPRSGAKSIATAPLRSSTPCAAAVTCSPAADRL